MRRKLTSIFAVPAVVFAGSLVGLLAALIGQGGWDLLAWGSLGLPVAATGYAMWARRR